MPNYIKYLKTSQFTDASLHLPYLPPIKVHKILLASTSNYFKTLFQTPTQTYDIQIPLKQLNAILEYTYTGNYGLEINNVFWLLEVVCEYEMDEFKKTIEDWLRKYWKTIYEADYLKK